MMKVQLIATDLDGTLNNDESQITRENIKAIKKAMDAGIKFVICSGRSYESIAHFNKIAGIDQPGCYGIAFNGSVVYKGDTQEIIFEERLKLDNALYIIEEIKKIDPLTPILVYAQGDLVLCEKDFAEIKDYADRSCITFKKINDFKEDLQKDILKILVHTQNYDQIQRVSNQMKEKLQDKASMFFSSKTMLEFSSTKSNKAEGLKVLTKHLNISMDRIAAVGDNFNDIEMIEEAGLGIAVANAVDLLKEKANYVTKNDNNNNAIAEVVELVLNENVKEEI